MKKVLLTFSLLIVLIGTSLAQSYTNPESIVYDTNNDRYFISNKGGNTIVAMDSEGNLTNFVSTGLFEPKGLLIVGDTLISVNSTSVQGFKLSDASQVFNVAIEGSSFMNDVATDGKGNLYVSDSGTGMLYKLSLKDATYSTLINSGISPNGLLFDEESNAIILCNWGTNAKIQSFGLADNSLTTLVTTKFSNLDGLARDNCGNIYVSSWGKNAVYVFDPEFKNPPTEISTGHNGPADISISENEQILAIPNFSSNSIELVNIGLQCAAEIDYVSPSNNSTDLNDSLKIEWSAVSGITEYELQYSEDSTFYSSVVSEQTTNSEIIIKDLNPNTKYFWRVKTIGGDYKEIFNEYWGFTTKKLETGMANNELEDQYEVYPNPAKNYIHIHCNNSALNKEKTKYQILDISGKLMQQDILSLDRIDISKLKQGLYFLHIRSNDGVFIEKIIVK